MAAPGLEPFSKDMESAVLGYFTGKAAEEFLVCVGSQIVLEFFVDLGLGGLDELEDFSGDEAALFVVFQMGAGVIGRSSAGAARCAPRNPVPDRLAVSWNDLGTSRSFSSKT